MRQLLKRIRSSLEWNDHANLWNVVSHDWKLENISIVLTCDINLRTAWQQVNVIDCLLVLFHESSPESMETGFDLRAGGCVIGVVANQSDKAENRLRKRPSAKGTSRLRRRYTYVPEVLKTRLAASYTLRPPAVSTNKSKDPSCCPLIMTIASSGTTSLAPFSQASSSADATSTGT